MTTYLITATWGAMKLSEEMDIRSDLTPENETQYAQNFILDKWMRIFGDTFINGADDITTEAVIDGYRPASSGAHKTELDGAVC